LLPNTFALWVWIVIFGFLAASRGFGWEMYGWLGFADLRRSRGIVAGLASACPLDAEEVAVF